MVATSRAAPVHFTEGFIEADGFRVRYLEAGQGDPLAVFHGGGGLRQFTTHEVLAQDYRVILFEVPGFGDSPVNDRSQSMAELALTMGAAISALGIERFKLMGTSFGGKLALWLAVQQPDRIMALILAAPAAIRPEGGGPPAPPPATDAERLARLWAHPERQPQPAVEPAIIEKQQALGRRIMGPARDAALEALLPGLQVPVMVVFGTLDKVIPPEMGRIYRELLPNCAFILVYDAGHQVDGDRPEAFVALATDFLQRQMGFLVASESALRHR